jgi:Rrf2 family protein
MHVSARSDYALRAATELAAAGGQPVKRERLAEAQGIPAQFLEQILLDLKRADLVRARRGPEGGFWLARPAEQITVADVIRAVDGPLAHVQGTRPDKVVYSGSAEPLRDVWLAVRGSLREVLEAVTLDHLARGEVPERIASIARRPQALDPR